MKNPCDEYADLLEQKAGLIRQMSKAVRIKQVWPNAFNPGGRIELFSTRLGGTGTVPLTRRYFIERLEDGEKLEITLDQWNFINEEPNAA